MTTRLAVAPAALRDIDRILDYLRRNASKRVADRYIAKFDAALDAIRDTPGAWPPRRKLGASTRMFIIHPDLVFYDHFPDQQRVRVMRVLHSRRNITRRHFPGR